MALGLLVLSFAALTSRPASAQEPLTATETEVLLGESRLAPDAHPMHDVKVIHLRHKGRTFQVVRLPRCEHVEVVLSNLPEGETLAHAKERLGGIAACTGSFHHPRSLALADFLQDNGCIVSPASTGRWCLSLSSNGSIDLTGDYMAMKRNPNVTALALGQRLVPDLHQDGFSLSFMNRITDRMALGLGNHYIYIISGCSDIWTLADFITSRLPCKTAVNSDGGHVVRGKAPVHIVFRWRTIKTEAATTTPVPTVGNAKG
jgi:hypothetical protein